jgi:pimeloyl-ACP methyl ester carboxylesterase
MELIRNGVRLAFDKAGEGDKSFIFIHGIGTNRQFFSSEFKYFCQQGQVLNIDLRGHGESDKPEQIYTMEEYAEDVFWLCEQTKIKNPIVIGHSMGGNIALELNSQFPKFLSAIVLLDTSIFFPEARSLYLSRRIEGFKNNCPAEIKAIIEMSRLPKIIANTLFDTPQYVWCTSIEKMIEWDEKKAEGCVRNCHIPILYIEGPEIVVDFSRFEAYYPNQLMRGKVVGSGHFLNVEVPEQVNSMIDRFNFICEKKL